MNLALLCSFRRNDDEKPIFTLLFGDKFIGIRHATRLDWC